MHTIELNKTKTIELNKMGLNEISTEEQKEVEGGILPAIIFGIGLIIGFGAGSSCAGDGDRGIVINK
jgi:hypothetical protein